MFVNEHNQMSLLFNEEFHLILSFLTSISFIIYESVIKVNEIHYVYERELNNEDIYRLD